MDVDERLKKFGFKKPEEYVFGAFTTPQLFKTGYPAPADRYLIIIDSQKPNLEEVYYWLMNHAKYDFAYATVDKITDIFAASEHSTFFGVSQQRVGIQQDRITQYLATIGKFIKELFQMVRELRVIDEKLFYYRDSWEHPKENASEITLKGMWIDLVEGGGKNPASVYGMARELQYTVLPDLFFSAPPLKPGDVNRYVDALDFNLNLRNVLKRKLMTFIQWKEKTYEELKTRKTFMIKYLRQHFDIIRMYMDWVKPYLRYMKRLQSKEHMQGSADLVSSFEGSMMEVEILLRKKPENCKKVWACLLLNFQYRSMPSMAYQAEGYQRGPQHAGEVKITFRTYAWSDEEVQKYKELKDDEDLELIGTIDSSLKAAMEELGDDLKKYLGERGEIFKEDIKEEKLKEKRDTVLTPFIGIFGGLGELLGIEKKEKKTGEKKPRSAKEIRAEQDMISAEKKGAQGMVTGESYIIYKNFKKSHGMIAWR